MKHLRSIYHFGKHHIRTDTRFLIVLLLVFVLLRLPSLIEPEWYGDEAIYQVIGQSLRHGGLLYRDIWDHKPPLLYIVYALANSDLYYVKLLSLLSGLGSVWAFFVFARALFRRKPAYYVASVFYVLGLGLPLIEGNIANAENFMMLPIILGFYTFLLYIKRRQLKYIIYSGVLFSISCLFKAVSVFDVATVMLLVFFINLRVVPHRISEITLKRASVFRNLKGRIRIIVPFVLAFSILPIITALYFVSHGAFHQFMKSVLSDNVGYVQYDNVLFFPMGSLVIKGVLLVVVLSGLIYWRQKIGFIGFAILIWMTFSLFNAFFSQRPYIHYVIVLLPSLSLYIGYLLVKQWNLALKLMILLIVYSAIRLEFTFYNQNIAYYFNYVSFITNIKSLEQYEMFFDSKTPTYYDIGEFIKMHTNPSDSIFFWGDSGQIYYLSGKLPPGRFIVYYHITSSKDNFAETKKAVADKKPKFIISTKDIPELEPFLNGYALKYTVDNAAIYEREL